MDARASIVNNNLNVLIKKLTKITLSLMVPTFVVSAFSVNVPIPFQRLHFSFGIVMGMALASLVILLLVFRHKKW
jgi:magnesium transporter